jgi:hypothetical protein
MKLTDRRSPGVLLAVYIPELNTVHVPNLEHYLSKRQHRRISTVPHLIQQLAWRVVDLYKRELQVRDIKVFAYAPSTLNNRRPALLIDPTVDLAATRATLGHDAWVTKYNPNTLRRIEDVDTTEIKANLDLQHALRSMGLPARQACSGPGATTPQLFENAVCSLD